MKDWLFVASVQTSTMALTGKKEGFGDVVIQGHVVAETIERACELVHAEFMQHKHITTIRSIN